METDSARRTLPGCAFPLTGLAIAGDLGTQTNWAIASPYGFEDGYMPPEFRRLALKHLLDLPLREPASFERFADRMIEDSRMVWSTQNQDNARYILRSIIKRTLINPLVDFGILKAEYEPHKTLGVEFRELSTFWITPFGKGLLEAIHGAMKQERPWLSVTRK